jgi:hypothetical protein
MAARKAPAAENTPLAAETGSAVFFSTVAYVSC